MAEPRVDAPLPGLRTGIELSEVTEEYRSAPVRSRMSPRLKPLKPLPGWTAGRPEADGEWVGGSVSAPGWGANGRPQPSGRITPCLKDYTISAILDPGGAKPWP